MIAAQLALVALLGGVSVSSSLVLAGCCLPAARGPAGTKPDCDASPTLRPAPDWRALAARSIEDAPGCVALVLIDPAKPRSEAAIARCLLGVLRPSDPVGRYGTRQVAALIQVDVAAAGIIVAERVRARLDRAGIDCVVGVSISVGEGLDELLIRATSDLMARRESAGISARW
jgi:hypothetical protein